MRNWYASINASPGFTMESFETLKHKADENKQQTGSKLMCCLMFDEMSIRNHGQWDKPTMEYKGFVDVGQKHSNENDLPVANDALVFMISGVEKKFKIPIAYFLTTGLTADEKAAIVNEGLIRLSEIGIEIVAMTFDGHPSNLAVLNAFGGSWDGRPYILDPADNNRKIYVLLDPAHMLKLARNTIGSRDLIDGKGGIISWRYFQALYDAQKFLSYNLGNKLSKAHMQWECKKMNVRLAAETLSNSVADSMEFMKVECEKFEDVDATVEYVRMFNDTFDVMNSTGKEGATQFKRTISKSTAPDFFKRFDECMAYIKQLKVVGETKPILSSRIHTAFTGFYNNMISFMGIYNDYVLTGKLSEIVAHRFSQDLLESFFGTIRSMGGKHSSFLKID